MALKLRVIKELPQTRELFPLGFETTSEKVFTKEDKVSAGFYTQIKVVAGVNPKKAVANSVWVEETLVPKGTYRGLDIVATNGTVYTSDWFYNTTGRDYTEFFEKIE